MSARNLTNRTFSFIRGLFPASPAHWLLLVGSTLLFACHSLRWWPKRGPGTTPWIITTYVLTWVFEFAGAAGYFVAFVRCKRPVRLLVILALLPALIGIIAVPLVAALVFGASAAAPATVAAPSNIGPVGRLMAILGTSPTLGPGFRFAVVGFVLLALFTGLLVWGRAELPISLPVEPAASAIDVHDAQDNRRVMIFVWAVIALIPLANVIESALNFSMLAFVRAANGSYPADRFFIDTLVEAVSLLIFFLLAMGKKGMRQVKGKIRLTSPLYVVFAAMLPALIATIWPGLHFVYDRTLWALQEGAHPFRTGLADYFQLPFAFTVGYFPNTFVEEIAWRGYLQPFFIHRCGVARGIFLVGVVWGAFHFFGDFSHLTTGPLLLLHIARRLAGTIALSYALAWMTMRSGSILPAAIAHGTYDVFVTKPWPSTPFWLLIGIWAIVGLLLFRFIPPPLADARDEDGFGATRELTDESSPAIGE